MKKYILILLFTSSILGQYEILQKNPINKVIVNINELQRHYNKILRQEKIKNLSVDETLNLALKNYDVVMLKFYATWCPPCRNWSKVIPGVANNLKTTKRNNKEIKFLILEIDIDQHKKIKDSYGVKNIPVGVYFAKGKKVAQNVGSLSAAETEKYLRNAINRV